jgi:pseudaminic acid biosynthesis-associated methylase
LTHHQGIQATHSSIQDFESDREFDLVFTCGVLIHLNPSNLSGVYKKMAALSRRYILINEYYNPTPLEISYRGHSGKLFKRDFGGEFLDCLNGTPSATEQIRLVDYGFLWQRVHPAWDNTTWWLFEKQTT